MIVYTRSCLACTHKQLWRKLTAFTQANNLPLEERRVGLKKQWQEEADRYDVELPFAVNGKVALNLNEPLEKLL